MTQLLREIQHHKLLWLLVFVLGSVPRLDLVGAELLADLRIIVADHSRAAERRRRFRPADSR